MKIRKRSGPNTVPWGTSDVPNKSETRSSAGRETLFKIGGYI
jgi:hypothetical protein